MSDLLALDLNAIAQLSAQRIIDSLLLGVVLTGFAAVLLRAVGRLNSGTRFAVWFSVLVAIAILSVVGGADWLGRWAQGRSGSAQSAVTVPVAWALYVFTAWAAIAGLGLARVALGVWQLYRLRRKCIAIEPTHLPIEVQQALERHRPRRQVNICVSDQLQAPTAIGLMKPAVVIPTWLLDELPPTELTQIVLHELAHLERWDDWTNLGQKVVKALLFFHPAVWWIEQKISLEREMACDDAVLAVTADPRAYAQCLVHLAEKTFVRRSLALAQAAVSRIRQTSARVKQILDVNRSGATTVWTPAVSLVAAFSVACLVGLAHAPQLVKFEGSGTAQPAASSVALSAAAAGRSTNVAESATVQNVSLQSVLKARPARSPRLVRVKATSRRPAQDRVPAMASLQGIPLQQGPQPSVVPVAYGRHGSPSGPAATFVLFVSTRQCDVSQGICQIQMWRITVLRATSSSVDPAISRKSI